MTLEVAERIWTPTQRGSRVAGGVVGDNAYALLLGPPAWARLKPEIRSRFSLRPLAGAKVVYRGATEVRCSRLGYLLAQLCRLIGTPVPPGAGRRVPTRVELLADPRGGVTWRRRYYFSAFRPIRVQSSKRIDRLGSLEEHLGGGLAMRLRVFERAGNLHFVSQGYAWHLGPVCVRLPGWLSPGTTEVVHEQLQGSFFRFTLRVTHGWFGELYYQDGVFR